MIIMSIIETTQPIENNLFKLGGPISRIRGRRRGRRARITDRRGNSIRDHINKSFTATTTATITITSRTNTTTTAINKHVIRG